MLKACWDCIAGLNENRDRPENDVAYESRPNGNTQRIPPWPETSGNEIMFLMPRRLNFGDRIEISGNMTGDKQRITVNLLTGDSSPDYQNIACQLELSFPPNEDKVSLRIIQNGYAEEIGGDYQSIPATDWFTDSTFNFAFAIRVSRHYDNSHLLDISIGSSDLEQIRLKHSVSDIRFLSLDGDIDKVNKLDFQFG